jgi:hypothetical protein
MLRPSVLRASVWFLLFVFPLVAIGSDVNAAVLQPQGNSRLTGSPVVRPTAVFVGDKIHTANGATATLTSRGTTLVLAADSSLVYFGNRVELERGSVLITTARGMSARVADLTISPAAGASARFLVARAAGTVQITALENRLAIADGKTLAMLEPGQTTKLGTSGNSLPHFKASLTTGETVALIFAVGAAVGSGLAVGLTRDDSPSSP